MPAKKQKPKAVKTSLHLSPLASAQLAGLVAVTGLSHSHVVALTIQSYTVRLGPEKRACVDALIAVSLGKDAVELQPDAVIVPE